jgi:glycosyltransferase involved in cell wall biosynthesis
MSARALRVLLVSPLPGHDPFNGDVVYTHNLLDYPPEGVEYVTYVDGLASGELIEHGRRSALKGASGAAKVTEVGRIARNRVVDAVRRSGVLFREPFRDFEIRGTFDLVHCHVFSTRWTGRRAPLVVSNALPIGELYMRARGWSERRTHISHRVDLALARAFGVDHIASDLRAVDGIAAFTETLREWYIAVGADPARIGVTPCSPGVITARPDARVPGRVGFVAGDFASKGGETLLRAWHLVRARRPEATLVIAGSGMRGEPDLQGVQWLGRLDRQTLLEVVMPTFDVFAYPSHFDGLPLTLLEALALGVPAVVSDYFALPEVLGPNAEAGRVVPENDPKAVAAGILELLDPAERARASAAARRRYDTFYAPEPAGRALREFYDLALARGRA